MAESIKDALKLESEVFTALPTVVKLMEAKVGKVKYLRFVSYDNDNGELVVEPFYKPISKIFKYGK